MTSCPVGKRASRLERVQQPQLDRIDVERGGELVHLRLGGEARLHRAEAAHRAARRVVRVDGEAVDQDVVDRVRADRERAGVRDDRGRARRVGAAVDAGSACARRRAGRRASPGARPRSAPGGGGCGRRTTPRGCRRSSPAGSVRSASIAAWICMERSSRPPNAPPTPARWIRTCSGSRSRHGATWSRSTWSHWVATWMSTPPSPSGIAMPGLGPEERLILLADVVHALDGDVRRRRRDRRAGSPSSARRSAAGRRGSRGPPSSAGRDGAAPSRSLAPDR